MEGTTSRKIKKALKEFCEIPMGDLYISPSEAEGVRVGYGDINHTRVLGEVAFAGNGSTPEVSYGTHFFNDLVEAGILSVAIFPDQGTTIFNESFLQRAPSRLKTLAPELARHEGVVHVIHVPEATGGCLLNV